MSPSALIDFHALALSVTLRCPFACGHCYTNSSPHRRELLDLELGIKAIETLWPLVQYVALSGGEPLLELERVLRLAEVASKHRPVNVVSSGYFAQKPERGRIMMRSLVDAGVSLLNLSYDAWHAEFTELETVLNAGRLAQEVGLRSIVQLVGRKDDPNLLRAAAALEREKIGHFGASLSPTGRAVSLDAEAFEDTLPEGGCAQIRSLSLDEAGILRACCGPTFGCGASTAFYLADVATHDAESLRTRVEEARRDPLFAAVSTIGPTALLALDDPEEAKTGRSICDHCILALGEPARASRLRAKLERPEMARRLIAGQLLARSTFHKQVDEEWDEIAQWRKDHV